MSKKKNLFAPPTPEEIAALDAGMSLPQGSKKKSKNLFAPPSPEETSLFNAPVPQQEPAPAPLPEFSELESAGLGVLQGGSLGFADEIEGAVRGGYNKLTGDKQSLEDLYLKYRDIARERDKQSAEQNPISHGIGNVGGAVATSLFPGFGGANIGKLMALGAVTGVGASEGTNLADVVKDAEVGAITGGIAGRLGNKIGRALTPEARHAAANLRAVKALDGKIEPGVENVGNVVLKKGLLPFMGGAEGTRKGISEATEVVEKEVQPLLSGATQVIKQNPSVVAGRQALDNDIVSFAKQFMNNIEDSEAPKFARQIGRDAFYWSQKAKGAINDPAKLRGVRMDIDQQIDRLSSEAWRPGKEVTNPRIKFLQDLRTLINNEVEGLVNSASTGLGKQVKSKFRDYSNLIKAEKLAGNAVKADFANPPGKLDLKTGVGLSGAYLLNNPWLAGVAGVVKGTEMLTQNPIRRLGNIASARTQHAMGNFLETNTGKAVAGLTEAAVSKGGASTGVQSSIQSLYRKSPEQLRAVADSFRQDPATENYGNALNKAVESGDQQSIDAILFAMEQRPDIRAKLRLMLGEEG